MVQRELIVLGDTTVGGFARELSAQCLTAGLPWTARDGGFDSWEREIFEPASATRTAVNAALGFLLSPRLLEGVSGEGLAARVSALLETLATHLRADGVTRIDTACHRDNAGAWRFYERLGFQPEREMTMLLRR